MTSSSPSCPNCGTANPPQAAFCIACGQALSAGAGSQTGLLPAAHLLKQRYQILAQVGRGGFGAVYQAEDTQLGNRLVAIKELSQHGLTPPELAQAADAFQREALLLAGLKHPNLPSIYDQFHEAGRHYLVMEFIVGQTLEDYLATHGGKLPVAETLQVGLQLCNVLSYLHTRQPPIIFRDLKPSNVMRTAEGQVYLIDFGIARHFKPGQMRDTIAFGSPGYAAPEQYGKAQTDPRSDLYSLGAILHQLLSGNDPSEMPFRFPPLPSSLPTELETLIRHMVELDEDKRPTSADTARQGLESIAARLGGARQSMGPVATQPASTPQPMQPAAPSTQVAVAVASTPAALPVVKPPAVVTAHSTYHHAGWVWDAAWSPDGKFVASASEDKTVQVWEAETLDIIASYHGHRNGVFAIAWSPEGSRLASASADCTVQVWQALTGNHLSTYPGHTRRVLDVAWSRNPYIVSCSDDQTVQVWSASSQHRPTPSRICISEAATAIYAVAWSPDDTRIAYSDEDGKVQICQPDLITMRYFLAYHGHSSLVGSLAWAPDSKRIASASVDGSVQVWDSVTGYQAAIYRGHEGIVYTVTWSPDGQTIASGGLDKTVHVWTPANPDRPVCLYGEHTGAVRSVAWSPDGSRIASGSLDKTVHIWQPTDKGTI